MQFSWYNCLHEKKSYIFIVTRIALYSLFNSGLCLWIPDVFFVCPFCIYQWHPALRLYSSVVFYSHFDLCNSDCCSSSDNLHNQKARKDSLHLVSYSFCEHNFGNCCFGIFLICDWDVLYYFQGRVHVNVSISLLRQKIWSLYEFDGTARWAKKSYSGKNQKWTAWIYVC